MPASIAQIVEQSSKAGVANSAIKPSSKRCYSPALALGSLALRFRFDFSFCSRIEVGRRACQSRSPRISAAKSRPLLASINWQPW